MHTRRFSPRLYLPILGILWIVRTVPVDKLRFCTLQFLVSGRGGSDLGLFDVVSSRFAVGRRIAALCAGSRRHGVLVGSPRRALYRDGDFLEGSLGFQKTMPGGGGSKGEGIGSFGNIADKFIFANNSLQIHVDSVNQSLNT